MASAPIGRDPIRPSLASSTFGDGLWGRLAAVHRTVALRHQWDMLERTGTIELFEAAAQRTDRRSTLTFTADSDLHKWIDAVARSMPMGVPDDVDAHLRDTVALLTEVQAGDGYLNAWMQTLYDDARFAHLIVEHESYTTGHLVEAAVSLWEATGDDHLLRVACRAVDALTVGMEGPAADRQDGHAGIELALVRLHRATGDPAHLAFAQRLVERRGTSADVGRQARRDHVGTALRLARQFVTARMTQRTDLAGAERYRPPMQAMKVSPAIALRGVRSLLSGRHWQNDRPVRQLTEPTGHAVAFQYVQTAMVMLAAELGDDSLRAASETAWERLVAEHLFVNGGSGALAIVEGFGPPYDLDPQLAYCETCASLAGVWWNRELGLLTGEARYDDLAEWQLLNGAAVGMSLDGTRWAYNNPPQARRGFGRRPWFPVPCCPSNLSRTWASVPTLATSRTDDEVRIHQYVSCRTELADTVVDIRSDLPWSGEVDVRLSGQLPPRLRFRIPSWSDEVSATVDGAPAEVAPAPEPRPPHTASGLQPHRARWADVDLPEGDQVSLRLTFGMPIRLLRQDGRIPRVGGKAAVTRGPLLFCVEGCDHPGIDDTALFDLAIDPASLAVGEAPDLLGDAVAIVGRDADGRQVTFVPYFLWGNRGDGPMTCFVDAPRPSDRAMLDTATMHPCQRTEPT